MRPRPAVFYARVVRNCANGGKRAAHVHDGVEERGDLLVVVRAVDGRDERHGPGVPSIDVRAVVIA